VDRLKYSTEDISLLEKKYEINFPKSYLTFIKNFKLNKEFYLCEKVYFPEYNEYRNVNHNYIDNIRGDVFINIKFLDLKNSLKDWKDGVYDIENYNNELFPIAESDMGDTFCLGIGLENNGKIIFDSNWPDRFVDLEIDIFGFLALLHVGNLENPPRGIKYSQLYKNWGEDFWRVREDKED